MSNLQRNELCIGNYIYSRDNDSNKIIVELLLGSDIDRVNGNKLFSPILLTDEWFEKFGFTNEHVRETINHGSYFSKEHLDCRFAFAYAEFRNDWGFYIEYTDSPHPVDDGKKYFVSCDIKYVHQLQNLWYLLTKEQLKCNIK